ncbi:MAG: hypothetical protein NTW19_25045 [Planctomycetota bacterium]|nr:hypothetical protein [Planctomycetota bacterium]
MTFAFGSAAALYKSRVHPRVLLGPDELAALRRKTRSGLHAKLLAAIRVKTAPLVERVHTTPDLPALLATWNHHWTGPATPVIWGLHDTALAATLDHDARAIDAVRKVLLALPAADAIQKRTGKLIGYGMEPYVLLAYDLIHEHLSPADRRTFCDWVVEFWVNVSFQRQIPTYYRNAGGNIAMGEVLTALMGLLAIEGDPGVPNLIKTRDQMVHMLQASLHCALGPEGYPAEDIGYGSGMGGWLAYLVEATRRAGLYDAYEHSPRFARFGRAMLHFVQPWGRCLSNTGDHGDDFGERGFVLTRLAQETRDPSLLWLRETLFYPTASARPKPTSVRAELALSPTTQIPADGCVLIALDAKAKAVAPAKLNLPTAYRDRDRGIVSFRNGWQPDATLVVFDGAHRPTAAQGHAHDSGGHFSLSAVGEYFGIDTGRYNTEQDQHNVVLVDGKSGQSTQRQWRRTYYHANLTEYAPGPLVDFASVDNSQMSSCYWSRRHIGLVKPVGVGKGAGKGKTPALPAWTFTVDDVNFADDFHEFWWALNTHPNNRIEFGKGRVRGGAGSASILGGRSGNRLDLHWVLPHAHEYPKPHTLKLMKHTQLGGSQDYIPDPRGNAKRYLKAAGDLVHGPVYVRPRLVAKVSGYNGRFMSLMIPRVAGQRPAEVQRLPSVDNSLAASIRFKAQNIEDTIIWAYDHALLEAGDVVARGQWVVVRRRITDGRVLAHAGGDLTELSVKGRSVKL